MNIHQGRALWGVIIAMAAGFMLQQSVSAQCGGCGGCGRIPATDASGPITEKEVNDLRFMHEEEKMARDIYRILDAEWDLRVFKNISRAEQRHFDATGFLLERFGQESSALEPGRFADKKLQTLHDSLSATGKQSKLDALKTGALIEEVDIEDLQRAIGQTEREDIRTVYGNLLAASKRHLNAFVYNIEALSDASYAAQHLQQAEVNGILGR